MMLFIAGWKPLFGLPDSLYFATCDQDGWATTARKKKSGGGKHSPNTEITRATIFSLQMREFRVSVRLMIGRLWWQACSSDPCIGGGSVEQDSRRVWEISCEGTVQMWKKIHALLIVPQTTDVITPLDHRIRLHHRLVLYYDSFWNLL